jgi:hypothetical protein
MGAEVIEEFKTPIPSYVLESINLTLTKEFAEAVIKKMRIRT